LVLVVLALLEQIVLEVTVLIQHLILLHLVVAVEVDRLMVMRM
jgi:hypothetical protein